ncbi:Fe(3+) ABC transporter substrate-binding protein [Tropicimonas sp. IMCC34011]|uniref:Fe(3+) ABC transporter substrate-binding protein n=1 Tax=Tropicimonas sp. IMCC34011 TaxID=2248759 RepID=UPI0018E4FFA4|nr:Fe(3+) ABC transporter substrate-binding protein [Tropicimonas sp. IMCC34011]
MTDIRISIAAILIGSAALPAMAEEVNVYSNRQPELIDPIFETFTEETGIEVNSVYIDTGIEERLRAEGARSPADLAFTVDIGRLDALKQAGVLQPVESDVLDEAIPAAYRDPDRDWFALTTRARAVYASRERVADGEITTYEALADPEWEGRICTRSGLHPYNIALTAGMIEQHGAEFTEDWLRGLKANLARRPQGNDRAQVKAISEGECDISLGNTYYMALMQSDPEQQAWADAVRLVFPTFEEGGTHVNISGVAMTKAAPNRENALQLMEYLATAHGQELYAEINNEYPVNENVSQSETVKSWGSFEADDANLQDLADLRAEAVRLMEIVDFDG